MARNRELNLLEHDAGVASPARPRWRCALHKLEPILVSAALAVSLHAVIFSVPVRGEPTLSVAAHAQTSRAVRVRTVPPGAANVPGTGGGLVEEAALAAPGASSDPIQFTQSVGLDAREVSHAGVDAAATSPPVSGLALRMPGLLSDEDFFARDALDVGPSPTTPVLIDYPPAVAGAGSHAGLLSLFIDDTGKVVRVRVDTPALPSEMQDAARAAFLGATFTPGLLDGLAVRSRIRVEVTFEAGSPLR